MRDDTAVGIWRYGSRRSVPGALQRYNAHAASVRARVRPSEAFLPSVLFLCLSRAPWQLLRARTQSLQAITIFTTKQIETFLPSDDDQDKNLCEHTASKLLVFVRYPPWCRPDGTTRVINESPLPPWSRVVLCR